MNEAVQISENFIKGDPITSCDRLMQLALDKKSVWHFKYKIKPASVIINMNFSQVHNAIEKKYLFETIPLIKLKTKK